MLNRAPSPRRRGFTLIELMVTLAVLALLLASVVPSLAVWNQNAHVRTAADLIQSGLRRAQSEAIQQNRVVAFIITDTPPLPTNLPAPVAAGTPAHYWYAASVPWTRAALTANGVSTASNVMSLLAFGLTGADVQHTAVTTATPTLCFSPYGVLTAISSDSDKKVQCGALADAVYKVTGAAALAAGSSQGLQLQVMVSTGGRIRLCDPTRSLVAGYADGC